MPRISSVSLAIFVGLLPRQASAGAEAAAFVRAAAWIAFTMFM